jgi:hypothetical protein
MRTIILAIALAIASVQNSFADAVTVGLGSHTCAQFADQYRGNQAFDVAYNQWAEGFMSGWNLALMDSQHVYRDLNAKTYEVQAVFLHQYCDNHPLAFFFQAAIALFATLPLKREPQSK